MLLKNLWLLNSNFRSSEYFLIVFQKPIGEIKIGVPNGNFFEPLVMLLRHLWQNRAKQSGEINYLHLIPPRTGAIRFSQLTAHASHVNADLFDDCIELRSLPDRFELRSETCSSPLGNFKDI